MILQILTRQNRVGLKSSIKLLFLQVFAICIQMVLLPLLMVIGKS